MPLIHAPHAVPVLLAVMEHIPSKFHQWYSADISVAMAPCVWGGFVLRSDKQHKAKGKFICCLLSPFKFICHIWLFIWWCTRLTVFWRLQHCTQVREFPLSLWIPLFPLCFALAWKNIETCFQRQYEKFQTLKLIGVLWQNPQEVWQLQSLMFFLIHWVIWKWNCFLLVLPQNYKEQGSLIPFKVGVPNSGWNVQNRKTWHIFTGRFWPWQWL